MKKNLGTLAAMISGLAIAFGIASAGSYEPVATVDSPITSSMVTAYDGGTQKPKGGGGTPGTCASGKAPRCYRDHCGWTADFKPVCPERDQCYGKEYCLMITDTQNRTLCATNIACTDSAGGGPIVIQ